MSRFLHAIITGLVGAAVVHITVLLLVPMVSERDAWARMAEAGDLYATVRLDAAADTPALIRSIDPLFGAAACRFDLREGVVHLTASGRVPFWSVSVHDRAGQNVFSFSDRVGADRILDVVIATPSQMIALRNDLPPEFGAAIFVEAAVEEGIAVVRAFTPDESWEEIVSTYLAGIGCDAS